MFNLTTKEKSLLITEKAILHSVKWLIINNFWRLKNNQQCNTFEIIQLDMDTGLQKNKLQIF